MANQPALQDVRREAERDAYRDGLLEIVVAGLLLIVALATGRPALYWTYLVALLILGPGLARLKAKFTYPRIGYFELPDEPPAKFRRGLVIWSLGVFLVTSLVLMLTGHFTDNLSWRRAAPAIAGLMFAGGFIYIAQRSGQIRFHGLAALSVLVGILMMWPAEAAPYANVRSWALILAMACLGVGAYVLRRFLKENPVVGERLPHGN